MVAYLCIIVSNTHAVKPTKNIYRHLLKLNEVKYENAAYINRLSENLKI
jgi:hypothetical protein